jgi:ABC-type multidrug transport system fused ATPase/permease subunit
MAVIGIWFWSSPVLFETRQPQAPQSNSLNCTSMALLGTRIAMSSSILRAWSLAIYAFFVVPVFNLLVPAAVFLALHISYHRIKKKDTNGGLSVVPVYIGLVLLLVVNVVFLVDIELMVHWAKRHQESPTEESEWTFGQTLAILLLILPLRDVFMFIVHVRTLKRHEKRHEKYTQELKDALENCDMHKVKRAVKHADIRVEALGILRRL